MTRELKAAAAEYDAASPEERAAFEKERAVFFVMWKLQTRRPMHSWPRVPPLAPSSVVEHTP